MKQRSRRILIFFTLFTLCLCIALSLFLFFAPYLLGGTKNYYAIVCSPENGDVIPYGYYAIGSSPFDYSSLPGVEDVEEEAAEEEADILSMVSPLYEGELPARVDGEGVGTIWHDVTISDSEADESLWHTSDAVCIHESEHAFYYLDSSLELDITDEIGVLAAAFEEKYPVIRSLLGEEGDVDGNGRIRFLITSGFSDVVGYYNPADQYGRQDLLESGNPYRSNESDMLYLDSSIFEDSDEYTREEIVATMCHEFSHMVFFNEREREGLAYIGESFIVEGLATFIEYYVGYPQEHDEVYIIPYIEEAATTSLFSDDYGIYGLGLLFFRYLEARYGIEAIEGVVHAKGTGIDAIEEVVTLPFDKIFSDFALCILSTAAGEEYSDREYYLPSLNDKLRGFDLRDCFMFAFLSDSALEVEDGADVIGELEPYSLFFFMSDGEGEPEFVLDGVDCFLLETRWSAEEVRRVFF